MKQCAKLQADAVEIHTGDYAIHYNREEDIQAYLEQFRKCEKMMKDANIAFHAGHGLDDKNILPLLELGVFEEYNVGHWVISQSIFKGLEKTVKDYVTLIKGHQVKA